MSKIDDLCATVARIEQKVDDMRLRCESHSEKILGHDVILRGGNGDGAGICEKVRTMERRHMAVSTAIPFIVLGAWEYVKHKMGMR